MSFQYAWQCAKNFTYTATFNVKQLQGVIISFSNSPLAVSQVHNNRTLAIFSFFADKETETQVG